jgi:hypothetical protein
VSIVPERVARLRTLALVRPVGQRRIAAGVQGVEAETSVVAPLKSGDAGV